MDIISRKVLLTSNFFFHAVLGVLRIHAKKGVLHRILRETNYTEVVIKIKKNFCDIEISMCFYINALNNKIYW